jgi:hypothetical protein
VGNAARLGHFLLARKVGTRDGRTEATWIEIGPRRVAKA